MEVTGALSKEKVLDQGRSQYFYKGGSDVINSNTK